MTMYYSDPSREQDPHALPDVEVFCISDSDIHRDFRETNESRFSEPGWYWWFCFPGCLPDGDPVGPFGSEEEAVADMHRDCVEGWG